MRLGSTQRGADKLKLEYGYGTTTNNGNVRSQTITVPNLTLVQSYTYDAVNRLEVAQESGAAAWTQTFSYDQYGNRTFNAGATTNEVEGPSLTISPSTNRITTANYSYDAAGNVTSVPNDSYGYDAENRLVTYDGGASVSGGWSYVYDGEGRRVKQVSNTSITIFVYNVIGQLIAEYSTDGP